MALRCVGIEEVGSEFGESLRREQVQKKELLVLFPKERRQERKGKATT